MNNTYFIGRLTYDPELKETESGKKVVNLTVAVDRSYKNKDGNYDADFIDCVLWEHNAEYVSKMSKGQELAIQGRIETKLYEKDGIKIKDCKVVADYVKNLDKSKEYSNDKDLV